MNNKIKTIITILIAIVLAFATSLYFTNKNSNENFNKQNIEDIEPVDNKETQAIEADTLSEEKDNVAISDKQPLSVENKKKKVLSQKKPVEKRNVSNNISEKKENNLTVKDIQEEINKPVAKEDRQNIVEVNDLYKPGLKTNVRYRGVNYVIKTKPQE